MDDARTWVRPGYAGSEDEPTVEFAVPVSPDGYHTTGARISQRIARQLIGQLTGALLAIEDGEKGSW